MHRDIIRIYCSIEDAIRVTLVENYRSSIKVGNKDYTIISCSNFNYANPSTTVFVVDGAVKASYNLRKKVDEIIEQSLKYQKFYKDKKELGIVKDAINDNIERRHNINYSTLAPEIKGGNVVMSVRLSEDISNCGAILMHGLNGRDLRTETSATLMKELINHVCLQYEKSMVSFTDVEGGEIISLLNIMSKLKDYDEMEVSITKNVSNPNSGRRIFTGAVLHPNVELDFQDDYEEDEDYYDDDEGY